ncbi:hypothetical protein EJB05_56474, partial [Eragrostis curvula]
MASMISGDFAVAYVLKNACKEETRRAEEGSAVDGKAVAQGKKQRQAGGDGASGKMTAEEGGRGGFSGLVKKKVHPKVDGTRASS